jgi:hypothetical protein
MWVVVVTVSALLMEALSDDDEHKLEERGSMDLDEADDDGL